MARTKATRPRAGRSSRRPGRAPPAPTPGAAPRRARRAYAKASADPGSPRIAWPGPRPGASRCPRRAPAHRSGHRKAIRRTWSLAARAASIRAAPRMTRHRRFQSQLPEIEPFACRIERRGSRLHALPPRHRTRQALHAASPSGLGRRLAAGALRREAAPASRVDDGDLHQRADRYPAALRRAGVLRAAAARGRVPGLGDAALRHLLAARGPDLRAPVDPLEDRPRRGRRGADAGDDGTGSPGAAELSRGVQLRIQAEAEARRGGLACPAHARGLHPCEPGRLAGRIRGARRPGRPVPDGLGRAVPGRPVRRRDRFDPHLRPRQPAQPLPGARGAAPAGPRVSDGRSSARRLSGALARAHGGRSDQGAALQGRRCRHRDRGHRVLPAALLRRHGDDLRLPRQRAGAGAARRDRRGAAALLDRHARAPPLPAARPGAADPAARGDLPEARGILRPLRRQRAAAGARQRRERRALGRRPARPQRRPRRARTAQPPATARGGDVGTRPDRRRERGPARKPARVAARQPHRSAGGRLAGRIRSRRRALRHRGCAPGAGLRVAASARERRRVVDRVRHRDRAFRDHAGHPAPPPPGADERRQRPDQGPLRAERRRPGRARQPWHRPLPRPDDDFARRPGGRSKRVPAPRIRREGDALRAGLAAAPDRPLHRRQRRGGDAAQARLRAVGKGQAQGRRAGARHRGRAAQSLCPARRPRGLRVPLRAARLRSLRRQLRLRGDTGPACRDPCGHPGHGLAAADGPPGLRRRRLRQDRGRAARRLRRRHRRQAGGDPGADDAARRAALPEHRRPLRQVADQGRRAVALPFAEGSEGGARRASRKARSTSSSARTSCSRPT